MTPSARRALVSVTGLTLALAGVVIAARPDPARASVTPGCVVDMTGAVGWWRGEDDLVGEVGPSGTGTVTFADAHVGRGMVFDGSSVVSVPLVPVVTNAVTVEAWVRPTDDGLVQALLSRWDFPGTDDSARSFIVVLASGGRVLWSTDETSTRRPLELAAVSPQLFDGAFHHLAATWSSTDARLYLDGVQIASTPSQAGVLNAATTTDLLIGGSHGLGSALRFRGVIDEPTVWGRALSAGEVSHLYAAGAAGKCNFVPLQLERVMAANPAPNSWFGQSVAINGTTMVAGSSAADIFAGTADVYMRSGAFWFHQATLTAADRHVTDFFGAAVAVDNDTIVIGAPASSPIASDSGGVYVFTRSGAIWTQQAKIFPADGAAIDQFGSAVDLDGDTLVVGAPFDDDAGTDSGAVYVFTRSGTTWTQQAKLVSADSSAGDTFGYSVSVRDDMVVGGSPGNDDAATSAGSASVFIRSAGVWAQHAVLTATDAEAGDEFGRSVDLDTDRVAVGAPYRDGTAADSGAVYVFGLIAGIWSEQAKLTATDADGGDQFGWSVAMTSSSAVVGARGDSASAAQGGAAYVFNRPGGVWTQLAKLAADDGAAGDQLGSTVALSGATYAVGAPTDDDFGNNSGAVYLFAG